MTLATTNPPAETLARLIDHHGALATLRAFVKALAARTALRRRARADADMLSNHLRRDIGLEPHERATPYWELR
ncbi:hypothetical protein [Sinisalibacter aestuarii]|uniref:DUF1127 domain-containing protein n=1 Tax=Sinisalibacter aestuarii TaxID=2949426 RepID=A0ABQ5LW34_9RHOB|nr:hypothetical protein [Sinisalibacter aestuarii]GKY89176.1 hypothetical protein STA1M1_30450 [Sinisalibacter aestuarii]